MESIKMGFISSFRPSSRLLNMLSPRCYLLNLLRHSSVPETGAGISCPNLACKAHSSLSVEERRHLQTDNLIY